ncbi:MAG: hypothetical protein ACXWEY_06050 [Bacteroidia bacterium]
MLDYTFNESPFFLANQSYCEKATKNLQARNIDFTGRCDSYGYEITAGFSLNSHNYNLKCYKYQIPRNGVIIPNNAAEYLGIEITGSGLNKSSSIKYGRNWFKRLLMRRNFRSRLPFPFYISTHSSVNEFQIQEILNFFAYYKIIHFRLKKGKLEIKIFSAFTDPVKIIEDLEEQCPYLL